MTGIPRNSAETYAVERAICDKADTHAKSIMSGRRNYLTAEEAQHPDYAACDNAMRSRVEQYKMLTDPPERFVAYVAPQTREQAGATNRAHLLTTWMGDAIGTVCLGAGWEARSYIGSRMYQITARVAGREYTGRTFGEGMCVNLRETAASRRARRVQA